MHDDFTRKNRRNKIYYSAPSSFQFLHHQCLRVLIGNTKVSTSLLETHESSFRSSLHSSLVSCVGFEHHVEVIILMAAAPVGFEDISLRPYIFVSIECLNLELWYNNEHDVVGYLKPLSSCFRELLFSPLYCGYAQHQTPKKNLVAQTLDPSVCYSENNGINIMSLKREKSASS